MIDLTLVTELIDIDDLATDEEPLPPYGTPGRVIIEIQWGWDDINVLDYDGDTSVHWLFEGIGIDYFVNHYLELPGPGRYLLEGVVGTYHRGDGWEIDDDEEWEVGRVSRTDLDTLL